MFENIVVVPWDFSDHARCALEFALRKTEPGKVRVICVLEKPEPYTMAWGEEKEDLARAKCKERFWELFDQESESGLEFIARFGDAATEIVQYANSLDAGMILMSTHGRTGIQRLMMGSVAQRVSQMANCPILLLPKTWYDTHCDRTGTESVNKVV